ncbi:hypothetical protein IT568_03400 [bacterium]|nr:hypothetical protein [bacterium]
MSKSIETSSPILVCEGRPSKSFDGMILEIVRKKLELDFEIVQAGSKNNFTVVVQQQFYENKNRKIFAIQDRDFKKQEVKETKIKNAGTGETLAICFLWKRQEIENYLLEPKLLANFISKIPTKTNSPLRKEITTQATETQIQNFILEIAKEQYLKNLWHFLFLRFPKKTPKCYLVEPELSEETTFETLKNEFQNAVEGWVNGKKEVFENFLDGISFEEIWQETLDFFGAKESLELETVKQKFSGKEIWSDLREKIKSEFNILKKDQSLELMFLEEVLEPDSEICVEFSGYFKKLTLPENTGI